MKSDERHSPSEDSAPPIRDETDPHDGDFDARAAFATFDAMLISICGTPELQELAEENG